jgi:hypothetical protein
MPSGNFQVGKAIPVTAAQTVILPRSGQMLGFWANASTTLNVWDSPTTAGAVAGTLIAAITACAVGWNPLPIDLANGLVLTPGAAIIAVVA